MPRVSAELIRDAVAQAGLLSPDLSPGAKREGIAMIAGRYGISDSTIYRQMAKMEVGAPPRRRRSDKGKARVLDADVVSALHKLCVDPACSGMSYAGYHRRLEATFPGRSISYAAVRNEAIRFNDSLPRTVSTPRRIEVSAVNERWEMDLSIMDCFLADPAVNEGYPFRPQLIVAEDSRSRCCLFAQYTPTGKAVDVGATLYNAIIPQSDIWPQCGVPAEVGCDWGKVFVGEYFPVVCKNLGIKVNAGHPYYPQDKGKVERFIGTIHNSFECELVGFCTNDNKGDNAIDPRKDFRFDGQTWVDPRFDKPLYNLAQANELLWDWVAGTYHTSRHGTLGCSPNAAWLSGMRGRTIGVPARERLEQEFLPWEHRVVRRGQIRMWGMDFHHARLADFEGLRIQVRFTPDDCRHVFCYYERSRICEAVPQSPFIMGDDNADWNKFRALQKANREHQQMRDEILRQIAEADIKIADVASIIHERAENALPLHQQPIDEYDINPDVADLSQAEIDDLSDIQVFGIPALYRRTA